MMSAATVEVKQSNKFSPDLSSRTFRSELPLRLLSAICGAVLGLSAPGIGQWYLVWFCMVPLIYFTVTARTPWLAGVRGFCFGFAYNLVYLCWYLSFRAVYGAGTLAGFPVLLAIGFWMMMCAIQGLAISLFPCAVKAIPLTGGWLPVKRDNRWLYPSFLVVPFFWVVIERMTSTPAMFGAEWSFALPWAFLEYSQYKQQAIIQIASVIGGIGISACIMLANLAILGALGFGRRELEAVSYRSRPSLVANSLIAAALLLMVPIFGYRRLAAEDRVPKEKITVAAIQSAVTLDIDKVPEPVIVKKHQALCRQCPQGAICVWPEWSVPLDFTGHAKELRRGAATANALLQSWVVGLFDSEGVPGRTFNSVCAFDDGKVLPEVYHKVYLVPFGERIPSWIKESILNLAFFGSGRTFTESTAGDGPVLLRLKKVAITPIICFENSMPGLVSRGIRDGGELIVDCSYTGWFHESNLSDQMIAFCVMRAAENHRAFVFSTTYGPSIIVDQAGRILREAPRKKEAVITADVNVEHDITPFTRFCLF